jgi:hypothetical protein
VMVHHHYIGIHGFLASLHHKAILITGAFFAQAVIVIPK